MSASAEPRLARRLGTRDAVVVGLGSMIGAGVFAAIGAAAAVAGAAMLLSLLIAGFVAYCNATSSAQLAALYPDSGGTYVYGRKRLGAWWGYLAGWGFVTGKTASCAAMALTFGAYADPPLMRPLAVAAVVLLTALNYCGIERTATTTRAVVVVVLSCLAAVVVASLFGGQASSEHLSPFFTSGVHSVLQGAALLFFAFAGYARIATMGEEVRDPAHTIPRAIPLALAITLIVYAAVAVSALLAIGPEQLGHSKTPLAAAVQAGSLSGLAPLVRLGAAVASLGVLLSMIAGVSRTTLAMARERDLPRYLASVHPRHKVPHHADLVIAVIVSTIVLLVDVRGAIGFSAFTVLVYYAIANVSAWTLPRHERRWPRTLAVLGLIGCLVLAATLPIAAVAAGGGTLLVGVIGRLLISRFRLAVRKSDFP